MASIRRDPKTGNWIVDHTTRMGRSRLHFKSRREAQEFKKELGLRRIGQTHGQVMFKPMWMEEALNQYLATVTVNKSPAVQKMERVHLDHFLRYFKGSMVHEVSVSDLQSYQALLHKDFKGQTVNRRFTVIRHFFNTAVDWNIATVNPIGRLRRLPDDKRRARRALSIPQLRALFEEAAPWLRDALWLVLSLALRRSEACYLRWGSIDFENQLIHIEASEGFQNKDHESNTLPMTNDMFRFLQYLHVSAVRERRAKTKDFVLVDDRREFIRPDRLTHESQKLVRRVLGLETGAVHILRHTAITMRHRLGMSLDGVREMAGHSKVTTTQIYLHSEREHLRKEMEQTRILPCHWLAAPNDEKIASGEVKAANGSQTETSDKEKSPQPE